MKVLVFAGSADVGAQIEATLRACGHNVVRCREEADAWRAYRRAQPQLVVVQGDATHAGLVRKIRALDPAMSVLAVIGADDGRHLQALMEAGVDDCLLADKGVEHWKARLALFGKELSGVPQLNVELRTRVRQQAIVVELGHRALVDADIESLMDYVVKMTAEALDASFCMVMEWLPIGRRFLVKAGVGWKEGTVGRTYAEADVPSAAGAALLSSEAMVIEDLRKVRHTGSSPLLREHGVISGMQVTIARAPVPYGVLAVYTEKRRSFTREDANFLQAVANILAAAVERHHAEEALRESEAKARAILETTVDGVISINEQGKITAFNSAAERIFGFAAAEVIGKNVNTLMPPPYREEHDDYIRNYLETGHRKIIGIGREVIGLRKDGTVFPMDLAVSEVNLGGRRVFTGIVRDITERRQLEQEILETSEQERRRIGQDLHDGLGQMLTGIGLISQNLARKLKANAMPGADEVAEITDLIKEADQQARSLARGLVPVELEANGLVAALQRLAFNAERLFGVACTFETVGTALIHDSTAATHLYRIAQEAVSNAVKHGKATQVTMSLASGEGQMRLRVVDDGVGFPAVLNKEGGMGVRIMHYRARMIGGTLDIAPGLEGGTVVTCTLHRMSSPSGHWHASTPAQPGRQKKQPRTTHQHSNEENHHRRRPPSNA